ncbi:hypothetical protein D3C76_1765110 [compost metagenome]
MIIAGSDITACVAFWMTLPMICWKPWVAPLSWFCSVFERFMFPHIMLARHDMPTPRPLGR